MIDRAAGIAQLEAEGLVVGEWRDDANIVYDEHAHPTREVRIVLEGSITFVVEGEHRRLGPGDRIDLGPMQRHSAVVGPDGARYLTGTHR